MSQKSVELNELLQTFTRNARDPKYTVSSWKEKHPDSKIAGCLGLDIPEPLIHASGMLPLVLLDRDEEVTLGNAHVENHMCGYIRSLVDQVMKHQIDFCDEIFAHDCCHIVRMICDIMHTFTDGMKKAEFVYFSPLLESKTGQKYTRSEMDLMRARLEDISGNSITDEALKNSIALYNKDRSLLIELYDYRRKNPAVLKGTEISDIVAASMCMPKEDHIVLMEQLLNILKTEEVPAAKGIPVIVHGSLCERCDDYVLECIEKAGGIIVDDDLYVGSRYFNTLYDENIAPMDALMKAYVKRVSPCPTRYEERNLGNYLKDMIEASGAKATIMVVTKFCEAHDYAYFTAYQRFERLGVKHMLVETEHGSYPEGQLMTRLEGFFESMED